MIIDNWGPIIWNDIHSNSINYPIKPFHNDKNTALYYYNNVIPKNIPCDICKNHYIFLLNKYPINLYNNNNSDLFYWTWLIHNEVNIKLNKKNNNNKYINCLNYWNKINNKNVLISNKINNKNNSWIDFYKNNTLK